VLTRRIVLRRSTVVLPSRTLLRIATDVWRLPAASLRYVPNGIDMARYGGPSDQAEAGRSPGEGPEDETAEGPVVGTVAALRPEKNLGRLLRAFRQLVDRMPARLVVAGDGPERRPLEALARGLGLGRRVRFLGHVDRPEGVFRQFDLFALSSDTEQMPLSVIEAMASGLAVAATDVGDVRDMLAADNSGSVVGQDEAAFADAMEWLLRDGVVRRAIGAANRRKARRDFDQAIMFAAYGELFEEPNRG
jgi:glycosyltransferase involved in cell wall biosynthesis